MACGVWAVWGWLAIAGALPAAGPDLAVQVDDPPAWQPLLSSLGLEATSEPKRHRIVVGDSAVAREAGFHPTAGKVRVASVVEERSPDLQVIWQEPLEIPVYGTPGGAKIFVREKLTGAPLLAGVKDLDGGLLWAAVDPGPQPYSRFPYLLHALVDLGLKPPFIGARTWAFFDFSYRSRVDVGYMARRWREAGIAALHVSAWHFHEPEAGRDQYLSALIEACHREGLLVYAWLELPHVSEKFWETNAECREKTAVLQDAHLDWRKLINLADPACFERAARGVRDLLLRFDWDGVNLAELYFESLHGPSNPQRFTPMNDWVREDYRQKAGFDPIELFDSSSSRFWARGAGPWEAFTEYRVDLAVRLQRQWLELAGAANRELDIVVTQIDDRFDPRMREYLGADTSRLLALMEQYDFRLVVEDPATLWDLGPERYREIAQRYLPLVPDPRRLAIDINIVERYQQTYPTKKQIGTELFQLVRVAGQEFSTVLLYFEHSISRPDWDLLPHAAATGDARWRRDSLVVEADRPLGVRWDGPVEVDGRPWPATNGAAVWLPPGRHMVARGALFPGVRLLYLNGDLESARGGEESLEFRYRSTSRAIALIDRAPSQIQIDGEETPASVLQAKDHWAVVLPRGRHKVRIRPGGLLR